MHKISIRYLSSQYWDLSDFTVHQIGPLSDVKTKLNTYQDSKRRNFVSTLVVRDQTPSIGHWLDTGHHLCAEELDHHQWWWLLWWWRWWRYPRDATVAHSGYQPSLDYPLIELAHWMLIRLSYTWFFLSHCHYHWPVVVVVVVVYPLSTLHMMEHFEKIKPTVMTFDPSVAHFRTPLTSIVNCSLFAAASVRLRSFECLDSLAPCAKRSAHFPKATPLDHRRHWCLFGFFHFSILNFVFEAQSVQIHHHHFGHPFSFWCAFRYFVAKFGKFCAAVIRSLSSLFSSSAGCCLYK